MAIAYNTPGNANYNNATMAAAINSGLNYWHQINLKDSNWWSNDVEKEQYLGPIAVLMKGTLGAENVLALTKDLSGTVAAATGMNMVWACENLLWRGLFTNQINDVTRARDSIAAVCDPTLTANSLEGLKTDWSFWQHGPMMADNAYGLQTIEDVSLWINMLSGTSFSFSQKTLNNFSTYFLIGVGWASFKGYLDFGPAGRYVQQTAEWVPNAGGVYGKDTVGLTPTGATWTDQRSSLINYINNIKVVDTVHRLQFDAWIANIKDGAPNPAIGDKHFWLSDYHSHRRADYFIGLKIASTRTKIPESLFSDNPNGFYEGVGGMYLSVDGPEYYKIYSSWDWALIPGTTTQHRNPVPEPGNRKGLTTFVGGASDGNYGVVGYDLNWDGVTGKKAWFFFDDEFLALGNNIASSLTNSINTTINQTAKNGDIRVEYGSGTGTVVGISPTTLTNPKWVQHGKFGYVFPQNETVQLNSSTVNSNNIFALYFNHGVAPKNASYQYIVMPNATTGSVQALSVKNPIATAMNTSAVQAAYHSALKIGGVVFYQADSVVLRPGLTIAVDKPCILLVKETAGQLLVTASNPVNQGLALNVTINWGTGNKNLAFNLPSGEMAGSSVTMSMTTGNTMARFPTKETTRSVVVPLGPGMGSVEFALSEKETIRRIKIISTDGRVINSSEPVSTGCIAPQVQLVPGVYIVKCETSKRSIALVKELNR